MGKRLPICLIAITFLIYLPVVVCGFIWDDNQHILLNHTLRSWDGLRQIWFVPTSIPQYYPVVHSTFWIEHQLWGDHPLGYHLINVALHALNAVLLFKLLQKLSIRGAFFIALLFAVHPVHVESVAWVTERKNVLSLLFYLLAFLNFWEFRENKEKAAYFRSLGFYGLALLSKSVTCSLPVAILIATWWKERKVSRKDLLRVSPMIAAGFIAGLHTVYLERHHVGALGAEWDYTFVQRCLIAGRALWFYILKLLVPINLAFIYPKWTISSTALWQYFFPISFLGLLILLYRKHLTGSFAAVLFFSVSLFPALGFFNVYPMAFSFVADHFQYIASIGVLILIAQKLSNKQLATVALVFSVLTFRQVFVYRDLMSLWSDTAAKNPRSAMVRLHLGNQFSALGKFKEAHENYLIAVAEEPNDYLNHNGLGISLGGLGNVSGAIESYKKSIAIKPNPIAFHNMGQMYLRLGKIEDAKRSFESVLAIDSPFKRDAQEILERISHWQRNNDPKRG